MYVCWTFCMRSCSSASSFCFWSKIFFRLALALRPSSVSLRARWRSTYPSFTSSAKAATGDETIKKIASSAERDMNFSFERRELADIPSGRELEEVADREFEHQGLLARERAERD